MIWTDWLIVGIIALSGLLSLTRGFVKEALSLLTWVAAFVIARVFAAPLAVLFDAQISDPALAFLLAFALLFVLTLVAGGVVQWLAALLIRATGISATDRILGVGFGLVRGVLVIVVMVALLRTTPIVEKLWWQSSALIPEFLLLEGWTREMAGKLAEQIGSVGQAS